MATILGLDIGGANIKAANTNHEARSVPFALWKNPGSLTAKLREVVGSMPPRDAFAVTMTGELCDCFTGRREGVNRILDSVVEAAGASPVRIWTTQGKFLAVDEVRKLPEVASSANWLAQATWAGRLVPEGDAILIDMGTTTTDVVPLAKGQPIPRGRTDAQRLKASELVYMGWRRTPVAAILDLSSHLMAETFATTLDVNLILDVVAENEVDHETADGRPATRTAAHSRLARMLGEDGETVGFPETETLARKVFWTMESFLMEAIRAVGDAFGPRGKRSHSYILAGSGEPVVRKLLGEPLAAPVISLAERLGPSLSESACAYAVAALAAEM